EKGLALEKKVDTGNVGDRSVDAGTRRVSLERDTLKSITIPTGGLEGTSVGILDEKLERSIRDYAEKKAKEGARGWEQFRNTEDLYEG
ncbi:hypothetical protein, partial [Klebsiella pneumoniae]|uniref:hypothetical protein n=1 Tax=Klebsiella pneumoniae TaxID=573 RepID=UPI003B97D502